ncbi:MAG: GtrA family protein, partial [Hyphomicrobiales bacterium]|nr:GtrA family protein [Hyphomicrobiales bacterium]
PPLRVEEIPYEFRARMAGESTLDAKVALDYLELLIDKSIGRFVPAKFVMFGLVGALGVVVHMAVLTALFSASGLEFGAAQIAASLTAMTTNFALNNVFTHHDRRLSGWQWFTGLASFAAASSVGLVANVGIATYLFATRDAAWYLSALAGIAVGAVWNYAVTSFFTWKRR